MTIGHKWHCFCHAIIFTIIIFIVYRGLWKKTANPNQCQITVKHRVDLVISRILNKLGSAVDKSGSSSGHQPVFIQDKSTTFLNVKTTYSLQGDSK